MKNDLTVSHILGQRNYLLLSVSISILTFALLHFLTLVSTAGYSMTTFVLMNGFVYSTTAFILNGAIAAGVGLYVSLVVVAFRSIKACSVGVCGATAGIFSAGCPMCGSAVLAVFGAPLGLFLLPLKGLELKIISFGLILLSVFLLSKNLNKKSRPDSR